MNRRNSSRDPADPRLLSERGGDPLLPKGFKIGARAVIEHEEDIIDTIEDQLPGLTAHGRDKARKKDRIETDIDDGAAGGLANDTPEEGSIWDRNRSEEPALIRAWQESACPESMELLIRRYRPLFNKQVSRIIAGRAVGREHAGDLRQEAVLAFIRAVDAFDPNKGYHLSALATSYVRNELLQYALSFRTSYRTGTSSGERKAYYASQALRAEKSGTGSDYFTDEEIETIQKQTGASMRATKRAVNSVFASSVPVECKPDLLKYDGGNHAIEKEASISVAMNHVAEFLANTDERSRVIIEETYLLEERSPTTELAERFNISVERVGQIRRRELERLARWLQNHGISAETAM